MKKFIKILLVLVLFLGTAATLSSCGNSEASEVKELVIEYFKHNNIDYSKGIPITYEVCYNYEVNGNKYYKNLPEKYYKVTTLGVTDKVMYKGMYDNKNEKN